MCEKGIERFLEPSNRMYDLALTSIKRGEKQGHWMWYIFPQLKGLGETSISDYYGITDLEEAIVFFSHPILGERLLEITQAVLEVKNRTAFEIFGMPDYLKLKSCMTLFHYAIDENQIFKKVIDKYYMGFEDELTKIKLGL